ncbi:MAG: RagB/SusD family nutrient uptake outer membrane protein [Capnocytophaga sp.]|nr:RagB/SusD family nutrient uptake outer membrane protein [Capnocytophaga sp.]
MKKINSIITAITTSLLLSGCFSLDQEPYTELSAANSLLSVQDAKLWTNGMYYNIRKAYFGSSMYATDVQADFLNMTNKEPVLPALHRWNDFYSSDATTAGIYMNYYRGIQNINIALQNYDNIPASPDASVQRQIRNYKGELLLGRAYFYSYLVTHFCPAYTSTNANTSDLGLVLTDRFKLTNFGRRSTLEETYNFILEDINEAKTLLVDKSGAVGSITFTLDAAKALEARVRLYKQDYEGALRVAKEIIATGKYTLASSSELEAMWKDDNVKESIVQLTTNLENNRQEHPEANTIYLGYYNNGTQATPDNRYNPNYVPTKTFVELFDDTDIRKSVYIKQLHVNYSGRKYDSIYLVNKFPDNNLQKVRPTGDATYIHMPKIFRIAEIYLIAAEAAFHRNEDVATYLNPLRTARGASATGVTLEDIKAERNRELCFEGFRLADIKRWQEGVVRGEVQNTSIIQTSPSNEYNGLNVPYSATPDGSTQGYYKTVWPMPPGNINIEGILAQNPGW